MLCTINGHYILKGTPYVMKGAINGHYILKGTRYVMCH